MNKYVVLIFLFITICNFSIYFDHTYGQVKLKERVLNKGTNHPEVFDPRLEVEEVVEGLHVPTSMAFLGPDDFLILEKDLKLNTLKTSFKVIGMYCISCKFIVEKQFKDEKVKVSSLIT